MNWMTSGRKRVQRSQKAKELRAKHFSKVAADRARAPVSQQVRAGSSSTSRQSADVSRLKSRWTQRSAPVQSSLPQAGRGTAAVSTSASAAAGGAYSTSPASASAATPVGPSPTPEEAGSLAAGRLLELDVTPPFATASRRQQYGSGGGSGGGSGAVRAADAGLGAGRPTRETAAQPRRRQEPAAQQHPMTAALQVGPAASSSSSRHPLVLERRQLVFGGMEGAAADHHRGVGEDYERQLLGGGPVSDRRAGAVAAETQHPPGLTSEWGMFGQAWDRPMRFFDAGVEVAHDGSPVPGTAAAPPQTSPPPPPPRLARFSAGRLGFPADQHDNDNDNEAESAIAKDAAGAPFGVTGSGEVRGLPRFSVGWMMPGSGHRSPSPSPSTPPEPWAEENLPPPGSAHVDPAAPNSQYLCSRSASDHEEHRSRHAAAVYDDGQPGVFRHEGEEGAEPPGGLNAHLGDGHVLLGEEPSDLVSRDAALPRGATSYRFDHGVEGNCNNSTSTEVDGGHLRLDMPDQLGQRFQEHVDVFAEFEVLARTWGLFGGALDSPQAPTTATATAAAAAHHTTTPPPVLSNDGAHARGTGVFENGGEGRDLQRGPPGLQVSVPVRATPHAASLRRRYGHPEGSDPEATSEETSPPPPPSSPVPAGGDDGDGDAHGGGDGGGSPELTMLFADEEPERGGPEAAVARHAGAGALEGGRRSSEPTAPVQSPLPPSRPPTSGGPLDPPGQKNTPRASSNQTSAPVTAVEITQPRQDEKTNLAANGTSPTAAQQQPNPDIDTDGSGRKEGEAPAARPELTTAAGDPDPAEETRQQPSRRSGGEGPFKEPAADDVVHADAPGGRGSRGGRGGEGAQQGGGGSQPSLPLPAAAGPVAAVSGPAMVSGAAARVDAAKASSATAAAAAAARTAATPTVERGGGDAAEGGCRARSSSREAARSGTPLCPETAPGGASSKAVGASTSSPDGVLAAAPPPPPPSSQGGTRKRERGEQEEEQEEEGEERGRGYRRRRTGGAMPTSSAAAGGHGASAGNASAGGGGGGGGGRGGGMALRAATRTYGRGGGGSGAEEKGAGWSRDEEEDAYSTVVWYRTVVACLTAASS